MSGAGNPGTAVAYRRAAVRLRQAAEWNRFDAEFQHGAGSAANGEPTASGPGRIVALVDANAVKLFMDPDRETHQVDPFETGSAAGAKPDRELLTFARIAAEFLFLSTPVTIGQEEGRLWKEAPLLAPGHAEEVFGMLRQIEAKSRRIYDDAQRSTEAEVLRVGGEQARQRVEDYDAAIPTRGAAGNGTLDGGLLALVRSMVEAFDGLFARPTGLREEDLAIASALQEAIRWLRLMRESKVRPLAVHPLCDAAVLSPPEETIQRFLGPLLLRKRAAAEARGEASGQAERLARRDAVALVQSIMLNERARSETATSSEPVRFVLISGDEVLHEVYAESFWRGAADGPARRRRGDYVLRRPLQYSPVLNAKDIPNGYRAQELFDELLGLLDTFTTFVEDRTDQAFALEYDWRRLTRARYQPQVQHAAAEQFQRLSELWREAIRTSSALGAALAVRDFGLRDLFQRLDRLASRDQAVSPLIQLHENIFSAIDGIHLPLVVQELLAVAAGALQRQRAAGAVAGVRMPLLLRERFERLTGGVPIDEFVLALAQDRQGVAGSMERRLTRNLEREPRRYRALFLAGTVAAVANHFALAARHLSRAAALLRTEAARRRGMAREIMAEEEVDRGEIEYLRAVMDRLRMRSARDYADARDRLNRLLSASADGSFERVRATSEMASLHLMRFFNLRFRIAGAAEPEPARAELDQLLTRAEEYLSTARKALPDLRRRDVAEAPLLDALEMQVHVNTLCWAVARSGIFHGNGGQRQPLDPAAPASLERLQALRAQQAARYEEEGTGYIAGFWQLTAEWLLAPQAEARRHKAAELHEFCRKRLEALAMIAEEFRPPVDVAGVTFMHDQVARELR